VAGIDGRDPHVSSTIVIMKFGPIKRQHGRIPGLDVILDRIIADCPYVQRIIPGRITTRRGKTPAGFKVQYPTAAGLKCLYTSTGTVQEVFVISANPPAAQSWIADHLPGLLA
jgi:hypothetical protein